MTFSGNTVLIGEIISAANTASNQLYQAARDRKTTTDEDSYSQLINIATVIFQTNLVQPMSPITLLGNRSACDSNIRSVLQTSHDQQPNQ